MKFQQLKIIDIQQETKESVSISFSIPKELQPIFNFKAGQYITLKFYINGKEQRRAYSLCSTPNDLETLQIAVKQVKNGLISNHINSNLQIGSVVEVLPPEGRFFVNTNKNNSKTYYLFAAGSGITPIISILKTVLLTEPQSNVCLIYGNRSQETIMFKSILNNLQKQYTTRLQVIHTLSKPKSNFWSNKPKMDFRKGRIDKETIKWFLKQYLSPSKNTAYYICGPGTMITSTKQTLQDINIPENDIFIESFGETQTNSETTTSEISDAKLIAFLDNERIELTIPKGETVLRTLLNADYDPPYSCEGGVCSSCICKVTEGKVTMKTNMALTDKEIEQGYTLSCQAVPLTQIIEVDFDE